MDLLVVSGQSGAGKSTSLHALEDLGYYCVDNVPVPLLSDLVDLVHRTDETRRVAVGIDARETAYLESFPEVHRKLRAAGHGVEILFFEAPVDVLVRRYSETRRKHPMGELPGAIERERALLAPIRTQAGATIDTGNLTGRQLRQLVRDRYGVRGALRLVLMSFGFRMGVPTESDLVLDARFLSNPFDDPDLRPLTGLHEPVSRYVLDQPDAQTLLDQAEALVRFVVPRSAAEGRSYLTVAIGCTGGQHRSVALIEELEHRLAEGAPLGDPAASVVVRHRDVGGQEAAR